ncbi:hypothetical protein BD779DRAFT_1667882 [Infundibulicybe gibba]|nr:hypothetical protein BD779DRAFT_1667882 [Infundibulicybe gibba]
MSVGGPECKALRLNGRLGRHKRRGATPASSEPTHPPTRPIVTMFSKILFVLSALSVVTSALVHAERAVGFVPLSPRGGVGAIQASNSDTRLYYQNGDGSINEISISNAFDSGHITANNTIIPANQAQLGTPIAAITTNGDFPQGTIHVYFFSPSDILSEYIWATGIGWRGGPSCTECLTTSKIAVIPGSKVLYAMGNPLTRSLRVGFESTRFLGTLTEADKSGDLGSTWKVFPLPN